MTPLDCRVAQGVAEAAGACLDVGQVGGGCAFGGTRTQRQRAVRSKCVSTDDSVRTLNEDCLGNQPKIYMARAVQPVLNSSLMDFMVVSYS